MKGTVPKRLDICYDFATFSNILNFYFLKHCADDTSARHKERAL